MKIFLDVGAHKGQTVKIVQESRYNFDKIICFEPSKECIPYIEAIDDTRIIINQFGLWKKTKKSNLIMSGDVGASIFKDKTDIEQINIEEIQLVKVSDWIKENIKSDDIVIMKINCEGSECDILDDLINSGHIYDLYNIMVHFDVRKIPSQRGREWEIRSKFSKNNIEYIGIIN